MDVEDEFHFLMNCDKLIHERVSLFRYISDIVPSFTTMSDVEKFMFLLTSHDLDMESGYRIEYVYLSIKDAHDRQYNYMKITIFTLIGMIRLIGFNIQDIQIHVNIQFCNQ